MTAGKIFLSLVLLFFGYPACPGPVGQGRQTTSFAAKENLHKALAIENFDAVKTLDLSYSGLTEIPDMVLPVQ